MRYIYFVGTAGSGKSTMVGAFKSWMEENGIDSIAVNLDPGADSLPYEADVDIREWVSLNEVMDEYKLGPNGAQIVASDLMAVNTKVIYDAIEEFGSKYVLIDTPGQLELFAFRTSSNAIVDAFGKEKSMIVFLSDPMICRSSNGFVSNLVLSSLVQFRLQLPTVSVLTKTDLLKDDEKERMMDWFENPDVLYDDLLQNDKNPQTVVGSELFKAVENIGVFGQMCAVSSTEGKGFDSIFSMVQTQFPDD